MAPSDVSRSRELHADLLNFVREIDNVWTVIAM